MGDLHEPARPREEPLPREEESLARQVLVHAAKGLLGVAIISFMLWKYDFGEVWAGIKQASLWLWLLAWASTAVGVWFHSVLLEWSLRPYNMPFSTLALFKLNWELRFYALFLPGATNMLVKWYKLGKGGHSGEALAAIVFTRVLHTFALLLLTTLGVLIDRQFPWPLVRWAVVAVLIAVALVLLLFISRTAAPYLDRASALVLGILPQHGRLRAKAEKLWLFITYLRGISLGRLVSLSAVTFVGQVFLTLAHIILARSIHMDVTVATQLWLRGVIMICTIIPVSISGMGLREASVVGLLLFYRIPEHIALAYSLLHLGLTVASGLVGGVIELTNHIKWPSFLGPANRRGMS